MIDDPHGYQAAKMLIEQYGNDASSTAAGVTSYKRCCQVNSLKTHKPVRAR
jgi:hypothetical protein